MVATQTQLELSETLSAQDTQTAIALEATRLAPTLTPTPTLTITPTLTPTLTVSPTLTLTMTPTATPAPCAATSRFEGYLYTQPSTGRAGYWINQKATFLVHGKLPDEPWALVESSNTNNPLRGWMPLSNLSIENNCKLGQVNLTDFPNMAGDNSSVSVYSTDFLSIDSAYPWKYLNGNMVQIPSPKESGYDLVFTVKGSDFYGAGPQDLKLNNNFDIWTAFTRQKNSLESEVSIRLYPPDHDDTYIEIAFIRQDCTYQYRVVRKGHETILGPQSPNFLNEALGCTDSANEAFVHIRIEHLEQHQVRLSGSYADTELHEFVFDDLDDIFGTLELVLGVKNEGANFRFVSISTPR